MDSARVLELHRRGIEAWIPTLVHASPGAEMLAVDGVVAAVVPGAPSRSIVNAGLYEDARGLRKALPVLAEAYERAGVAASTMWMLAPDPEAERILEQGGYALDGEPAAMFCELAALPSPEPGDLDWDADATPAQVGRVNDLAYGHPEGEGVGVAIGTAPPGMPIRSYRARVDGELSCVLQTVDLGSDCLIIWVATVPDRRGLGLASRLLRAALADAQARGLRTSTLQASMLGRGVYQRVGYELVSRLRLYERRLTPPG